MSSLVILQSNTTSSVLWGLWQWPSTEQGSSIPAGVKYSTAEAQREPGLSLVPNYLLVGASLYGFLFFFIKDDCPQNYMLGETVGLGSQRSKSITEINVFQEHFSATLLFFYLPCNKPIFRRFLNLWCKALSSCSLGAIRRIKHWLRCKIIPVPAALVCSSLLWEAEVTTEHLTHFLFSSSTSPSPKHQVGIVIRSKRVSQPRKINVERSGTDLGTRTTLSDKFCSFLHRVTWGITILDRTS